MVQLTVRFAGLLALCLAVAASPLLHPQALEATAPNMGNSVQQPSTEKEHPMKRFNDGQYHPDQDRQNADKATDTPNAQPPEAQAPPSKAPDSPASNLVQKVTGVITGAGGSKDQSPQSVKSPDSESTDTKSADKKSTDTNQKRDEFGMLPHAGAATSGRNSA